MARRTPFKRAQHGIALLEALIATVILALGLLGAMGMQARAYSALSDAGQRAEATMASENLLAIMTLDQANLASYVFSGTGNGTGAMATWLADTRTRIPGATVSVAVAPVAGTSRSQVDVVIGWTRTQGAQANSHSVTSYIANSK